MATWYRYAHCLVFTAVAIIIESNTKILLIQNAITYHEVY